MKVEEYTNHDGTWFVIRRGGQYFALFVDADKTSWTKWRFAACRYTTREKAEEGVARIKQRIKLRKESA